MKRTLYIMCEEGSETRYTGEWNEHLPKLFTKVLKANNIMADVVEIEGDCQKLLSPKPYEKDVWKATQLVNLFSCNLKDGDVVLYTDAWNPTILQLKQLISLQNIDIKILGIWHSGNYDPQDLMGRVLGDSAWIKETERALFNALDSNIFATEFHADMFIENLLDLHDSVKENYKHFCKNNVVISGFPFEYLPVTICDDVEDKGFLEGKKKKQIVFPHKMADEKQPQIFRELAKELPDFNFVMCQEKELTKKEYHKIMAESMLCWSANLQETYGIGMIEATHLNTVPLCPNRLSYSEMYINDFLYPSEWTKDYESFLKNKADIVKKIRELTKSYIKNPKKTLNKLYEQRSKLERFISSNIMLECIMNYLERPSSVRGK